jgi:GntR family transcriptional regulator
LLSIDMENVKSSVPQYIKIADSLIHQIETGDLKPGTRLPSERKMSVLFDVNRLTLRRALSRLETRGLIVRKHGKGNFVAEPKIERQTKQLVTFTNGIRQRGLAPGAKVITVEQQPVEVAIAQLLDIPVLSPVFHVLRLRMLNQEPVMLEQFWVPANKFPGLEDHDLSNHSVHEIMKNEYGTIITRTQRSLEPVIASRSEAEILAVGKGAPLMMERRLGFDQDSECVEFSKDLYRGDRFRFIIGESDE